MSEVRRQESVEYKPGTFCWVELGTSNAEAAKSFYSKLFDWTLTDNPMGPDMVYTMLKINDKDVGGLFQLMPDMVAQGIPPHWLSYVSVSSVDESVEKIKSEGGAILNGPFDVSTIGRMAVAKDPTGAVFALWQSGTHQGAGIYNVPNTFAWNELGTRDTKRAGEFYSNVFGWTRDVMDMGALEYTMFKNAGRDAGGMYQITSEMGNLPPHWLVYFSVDDCDAKVVKATQLGAKVMKPADDIPGVGRFAILIDPQGAAFAIIKLNNIPQ